MGWYSVAGSLAMFLPDTILRATHTVDVNLKTDSALETDITAGY